MNKSIEGLKKALDAKDSHDDWDDDEHEEGMIELPEHDVYAGAEKGPFKCSNCEYFTSPNKCSNSYIIKLRKGVVEPEACCDFFEAK